MVNYFSGPNRSFVPTNSTYTNAYFGANAFSPTNYAIARQAIDTYYPPSPENVPSYYPDNIYLWSNTVPAYVELELGIMEPQIYKRYQAIGNLNPVGQAAYLSNHVAQVHIFRQRIPIRGVDPTAYQ